jgi:hypothetical protein
MVSRTVTTSAGNLMATVDPGRVWRVGRRPNPWAWTPWEYAGDDGRFDGRWDDPAGRFRTVYAGADLLGCLLEVLARFRPDTLLAEDLAAVHVEPDDTAHYPTQAPGAVPRSWLTRRVATTAMLDGVYCAVTDKESLPTLRYKFLPVALSLGLADLDAGSLRLSAPRSLTQRITAWLYELHDEANELFAGAQFASRHGDDLTLFALFERAEDGETSTRLRDAATVEVRRDDQAVLEAFRLHRLVWDDRPG